MNLEAWLKAKGIENFDELSASAQAVIKAQYEAEIAAAAKDDGEDEEKPKVEAKGKTDPDDVEDDEADAAKLTAAAELAATGEVQRIDAIRQLCGDEHKAIAAKAIKEKWTTERVEAALYQASRSTVNPIIRSGGVAAAAVLTAAACLSGGMANVEKQFDTKTLEAAHSRFRGGIGLQELIVEAARANGWTGTSMARDMRGCLQAAFSSVSLSGILSTVANKFILEGWNGVEMSWREVAAVRAVKDFKRITSYRMNGAQQYDKLSPDGEIKHGKLEETEYGNQADTYAKMLAITRKMIINDDLGALTQIPRMLGRGAALKLNDVFWTEFLADAATFFPTDASLGNYQEGAATVLSIDSLTAAELLALNQTDPDGKPLGVTPQILLTPNALSVKAQNLMTSLELRDTTASTKYATTNPHAGKYKPVRSSYLGNAAYTGYSVTAWYLLANPADLPMIEVAFLNGQEAPTVESADADFNTLGIQMRGYHDFGVEKQEYRAAVKSKGAV